MQTQLSELYVMTAGIALNLSITVLIVHRLHAKGMLKGIRKHALVLFNLLIFIFCSVLIQLDISIGAGVGLFAVLAMVRFRSEVLKMEELIYLLMFIGLGFIHASIPDILRVEQALLVDLLLVGMTFLKSDQNEPINTVKVRIDNLDLLRPANHNYLRELLEAKTGYKVKSIEVLCLNLRDEEANLMIELLAQPSSETKSNGKVNGAVEIQAEQRPQLLKVKYLESLS